jgi:3-hydroxyisobutyryl-CoA hydrolase
MENVQNVSVREAAQFMYEEYQLNHLIATTPKPFVSIGNGIICT